MANYSDKTVNTIKEYYSMLGYDTIIGKGCFKTVTSILFGKGKILVSDDKAMQLLAKCRRTKRAYASESERKAEQFLAICDAVSLLNKKGIPVLFYNRVGKLKDGYRYRDTEQRRMELGLDFPKMYEDKERYAADLAEIFGKRYSPEYVEEIGKIPQVVQIGDRYCHEDCIGRLINVVNGERAVTGQPEGSVRTLHIYGRCGVFGYAVEDSDTIPSLLQAELNSRGISDIRVVNHGLWGGIDEYLDHNFLEDAVGMKPGDIVVFYRKHLDKRLMNELISRGVYYKEITDEWHRLRDDGVTFYNQPGHMNAEGYALTARLLADDMLARGFGTDKKDVGDGTGGAEHLTYYLKKYTNVQFQQEIDEFVSDILKKYPATGHDRCGAIVMNCNPFTNGHRYLIETAAGQVDRLYIFVVEEDKSFFRFSDRFEMVKRGTADIENVVVVPSGKFIISAYTFPEYFMKDYVKEKNFDVSMDVETFCKYIAPPLDIKVRFAGEEPFDPVTKNYNDNMRCILPEYGMEFCEIPRLALDSERVINATRVRELLASREFDELKEYVPESTYDILMEKYI